MLEMSFLIQVTKNMRLNIKAYQIPQIWSILASACKEQGWQWVGECTLYKNANTRTHQVKDIPIYLSLTIIYCEFEGVRIRDIPLKNIDTRSLSLVLHPFLLFNILYIVKKKRYFNYLTLDEHVAQYFKIFHFQFQVNIYYNLIIVKLNLNQCIIKEKY